MKIGLYVYYFFRSVALRGFINTLRLLRRENAEERRLGIETAKLQPSKSSEYFHYQGAPYFVLEKLFKRLGRYEIPFIDIGSGKGRVIISAADAGYKDLTGIELHPGLVQDSIRNLEKYGRLKAGQKARFACSNILDYNFRNEPATYFLFNPFNAEVLASALQRILSQNDHEIWFVYMNPLFKNEFEKAGLETAFELRTLRYLEAVVYMRSAKAERTA